MCCCMPLFAFSYDVLAGGYLSFVEFAVILMSKNLNA